MRPELKPIGVRWTIGDVSLEGFEALQFSVWGVWNLFADAADYVVCVNSVPLSIAQDQAGALPDEVCWQAVTEADAPAFLRNHLDTAMAEGVAWKFAPLRIFPDRHELSLDNDCILWALPGSMREWLASEDLCILAEDVKTCLGQYAGMCGPEPRNSGIRGLPPGFDLAAALETMFLQMPFKLQSELDEQGLQVAALSRCRRTLAVPIEDVTICSPFPPHLPRLGKCGVHFVGLNARELPWTFCGRGASELTRENWNGFKTDISQRVGITQAINR
jgi:hypothetical protein